MIGADQFAAMKTGAVYINTARAQLHDHDALVDALQSRQLAGAALDHFVGENLATDDPLVVDGQRGAHAPHRRRHLGHRGPPGRHDRRRPRAHPRRRAPVHAVNPEVLS